MRLLLCLFLVATAAHAQYPAKPVRVVIGYAAGSSTDIVGRVMAGRLAAYWKQNVYVETRAGAAGNLAADAVAKAPGDGYTQLFAQNGLAISAAALPNLPFNAERDLLPLAPVAATPHILIVAPEFPAKSVRELIARAKAEPGRLSFASSGVGNSDHLCGELFNLMAGISAIHVPYKGGAPAATDVMGGRIGYYFAGMPVGLPLAKAGRARALGVTSKARFPGAPGLVFVARGDRDEHRTIVAVAARQFLRHLKAVAVRHFDIQQHDVRTELPGLHQRPLAVLYELDLVALAPEQDAQGENHVAV